MRWVIRNFRTDIATVSFTDIKDMAKEEVISVAPNPANDNVNIVAKNGSKIITVALYNTEGQLVFSDNCNDIKTSINTAALADGIYFVELTTQQSIQRTKLVVKH